MTSTMHLINVARLCLGAHLEAVLLGALLLVSLAHIQVPRGDATSSEGPTGKCSARNCCRCNMLVTLPHHLTQDSSVLHLKCRFSSCTSDRTRRPRPWTNVVEHEPYRPGLYTPLIWCTAIRRAIRLESSSLLFLNTDNLAYQDSICKYLRSTDIQILPPSSDPLAPARRVCQAPHPRATRNRSIEGRPMKRSKSVNDCQLGGHLPSDTL